MPSISLLFLVESDIKHMEMENKIVTIMSSIQIFKNIKINIQEAKASL